MSDELLISVKEAAHRLGIGRSLLYQMISDGRFGPLPINLGRKTLIRVTDLQAWVAAGCPPRRIWLKQSRPSVRNPHFHSPEEL